LVWLNQFGSTFACEARERLIWLNLLKVDTGNPFLFQPLLKVEPNVVD
jgi:hypothetical protein